MSIDLISPRPSTVLERIARREDRRDRSDVAATSARTSAVFGATQRPTEEVDRISKLIASAKVAAVAASVETAPVTAAGAGAEKVEEVEELLASVRRPRSATADALSTAADTASLDSARTNPTSAPPAGSNPQDLAGVVDEAPYAVAPASPSPTAAIDGSEDLFPAPEALLAAISVNGATSPEDAASPVSADPSFAQSLSALGLAGLNDPRLVGVLVDRHA